MELQKNILRIAKILPYSDKEIGILQDFFLDWCELNSKELTKKDFYIIAIVSTQLQYNIRILKARINGDDNYDIESNNKFLEYVSNLNGLIEFVLEKLNKSFNSMSLEKQFNYLQETYYSYFNADDKIINEIINEGEKFLEKI